MQATRTVQSYGALAACVAASLAGCGGDDNAPGPAPAVLEVKAVSTRADMVTGGDVLVDVALPAGVAPETVTLALNGRDVSAQLKPDSQAKALRGVVSGLSVGDNVLTASGANARGELKLKNFPLSGPVFSGPQEKPFLCQTAQFRIYPNGPFLPAAQDAACSVATRVDYVYRAADDTFKPLDPQAVAPADMKQAVTKDGASVLYVVRLETGVINRAIYQTAVLHDPKAEQAPSPGGTLKGWNQRLVYPFGGGCGGGWYAQGTSTGGVLNDLLLSQGYGVASSSLNVLGTNCNDIVSAETVMMVKERFAESYGAPRYTIGFGCSGAAIQQYMIGSNYPGLLDGLVPSCTFPDVSSPPSSDARLLYAYYNGSRTVPWSEAQIAAASGYWGYGHIVNQHTVWAPRFDPTPNRPNGYRSALFSHPVPDALRFDPVTNPTGARATHWDHTVNAFGRDPATGYARRAMDNVGVQYGLAALNDGRITKDQFIDLNDKIGGFDINGTVIAQRTQGDPLGIRAAYETGRLMQGGGGLASIPIVDWDQIATDELPAGDLHLKFYHYMVRARLVKANGDASNMVMWNGGQIDTAYVGAQALARVDEWLARIASDTSGLGKREKMLKNKPADLTDGCWKPAGGGGNPVFIAEPQFLGTRGSSACNSLYPGYSYPRGVAGEPAAADIVKCALRPIDPADYKVAFSAAELVRLNAVFPGGVCDYSKPGVEQKPLAGTWLRYPAEGQYLKDTGN